VAIKLLYLYYPPVERRRGKHQGQPIYTVRAANIGNILLRLTAAVDILKPIVSVNEKYKSRPVIPFLA
jgi:hypothetical protein